MHCINSSFLNSFSRDGNLKRMSVKDEWKAKQQEQFSRRLKLDWIDSRKQNGASPCPQSDRQTDSIRRLWTNIIVNPDINHTSWWTKIVNQMGIAAGEETTAEIYFCCDLMHNSMRQKCAREKEGNAVWWRLIFVSEEKEISYGWVCWEDRQACAANTCAD